MNRIFNTFIAQIALAGNPWHHEAGFLTNPLESSHIQPYPARLHISLDLKEWWCSMILSGWWLSHLSEKYEFLSWDDYSQCMGKQKKNVPIHQPALMG